MSLDRAERLSQRLTSKGYTPSHVCEVGVYLPETCSVRPYILVGKKATLVEANPVVVEKIVNAFRDYPQTKVYPCAVSDRPGKLVLYNRGASTFVENVLSPAMVNDRYQVSDRDRFEVEARTFDQIDDGTIDLLCIDIEGAEWHVLSSLKSKPDVISVETHGKYYVNPRIEEIGNWMKERNYQIWYKDKSDTVFINPDKINLSLLDSIRLTLMEFYISFRRLKGFLRGRIN